jgi:hypothetical protein
VDTLDDAEPGHLQCRLDARQCCGVNVCTNQHARPAGQHDLDPSASARGTRGNVGVDSAVIVAGTSVIASSPGAATA